MFRRSIIILAAAATLGVAALATGPASAHRGGHMGGFHHMRAHMAFHHRVFVRHLAFRHRIFVRRHIAAIGCMRVHWVHTHWGWKRRHVWVCG